MDNEEQNIDMDINNQGEQVQAPDTLIIDTKGKWQPFEAMVGQVFEVGKTYHIHVAGICEFGLSESVPLAGIQTNDINYTKNDKIKLWIKTGEKING